MKTRFMFGAIATAGAFLLFTWASIPLSLDSRRLPLFAYLAAAFFGPLTLFLWAITARSGRRAAAFLWVRRAIILHAVIAACIVVTQCTSLRRHFDLSITIGGAVDVFAAAGLVVDIGMLALSPSGRGESGQLQEYRRWLRLLSGAAIAFVFVWSLLIVGLVVAQAEIIAAGRPYCVQIGKPYRPKYQEATSLLDFNGLVMHVPHTGWFHAVLAVPTENGNDIRNWSYMTHSFRTVRPRTIRALRLRVVCQPRDRFALSLSPW